MQVELNQVYTIKIANGDEIEILRVVSGYRDLSTLFTDVDE